MFVNFFLSLISDEFFYLENLDLPCQEQPCLLSNWEMARAWMTMATSVSRGKATADTLAAETGKKHSWLQLLSAPPGAPRVGLCSFRGNISPPRTLIPGSHLHLVWLTAQSYWCWCICKDEPPLCSRVGQSDSQQKTTFYLCLSRMPDHLWIFLDLHQPFFWGGGMTYVQEDKRGEVACERILRQVATTGIYPSLPLPTLKLPHNPSSLLMMASAANFLAIAEAFGATAVHDRWLATHLQGMPRNTQWQPSFRTTICGTQIPAALSFSVLGHSFLSLPLGTGSGHPWAVWNWMTKWAGRLHSKNT